MVQPVLQIDAGERGRKLAQIAGGRADQAAELAEAPMRRRDRLGLAGQDEREALGVVPRRLDAHVPALERCGRGAIGASLHGRGAGRRGSGSARPPGGENHSEQTRPMRWPRLTSTL